MTQNPMHTREQGENSFMNLIGGMMGNLDGFVDKMDAKVAGVMGSSPAMDVFTQQAAQNGTPVQQQAPQMPQPQQMPQQQTPAPTPQDQQQAQAAQQPAQEAQAPQMPPWMQRLPPETQKALMSWQQLKQDRMKRGETRRQNLGIMYRPERFEL